MTADTDPALREQSCGEGFLYKPFTEALLLEALEAAWANPAESPAQTGDSD
jgi:FixJ family two-component response regulator